MDIFCAGEKYLSDFPTFKIHGSANFKAREKFLKQH